MKDIPIEFRILEYDGKYKHGKYVNIIHKNGYTIKL